MSKFSGSSLISLIIFYIVVIVLIVLFAYQVLNSESINNNLSLTALWIAVFIVPGILLSSIVVNLVRLFREHKIRAPGIVLKTRLIMYFLILVILSAGPQALLSLSFIRVIGDTWFNDEIGEGLENSLEITVDIQRSLTDNLEKFMYSPLFESLAERAGSNADRFFIQLGQIRPSIVATQIFSSTGEGLYSGGNEDAWVEYPDVLRSSEGSVVRDVRQDRSFIRIKRSLNDATIVIMEELPVGFGGKTLQILEAFELFTEYRRVKNLLYTGILLFYGFFSLPLVFLAILAGFYLSNALIQPIVNLENAIRKVAEGDFSFRILSRSQDVMGTLVESFNLMLSELDSSRNQLVQSERVAAWKDIAQRLAHEIKNPLTPIKLSIERLERKHQQKSDDFSQALETSAKTITREVDHLAKLITEFRDFARLPLPHPQNLSLFSLVSDLIDAQQRPKIRIIMEDIDEETRIYVDGLQFRQVITNVLINAIEAIGENNGEIRISNLILSLGGRHFQRIQIQDNGSGIDKDTLPRIFDPYFTSKEEGTGLGLAIAQRIIQDHNGKIRVESEPGNGSRFFIDLPILENI